MEARERRERETAGDGNAVFMEDMTDAEYAQHIIEHDHGWKEFYDKVLGRKSGDGEGGGTPIEAGHGTPVLASLNHDPQADT